MKGISCQEISGVAEITRGGGGGGALTSEMNTNKAITLSN